MTPDETNAPDPATGREPADGSVDELRRELEAEKQRIAALEAENAELVAASGGKADGGDATRKRGRRSHRFWIAILLVIATVLTPLTIVALFVKNEITDTTHYVQTVRPLASNAAIQAYVAEDVSRQLFKRVNIKKYVKDALPRRADVLAGPLTGALQGFVRQAVERILETEQFERLWVEANRVAHTQLVNVLTGSEGGEITATDNGEVSVDLSAVTTLVQERLEETGIDLFSNIPISNIGGRITIFQSNDLYKARSALRILDTLVFVLPFMVIGCYAGVIALSRNRRRGFVVSAVSFAIGALILAIALWIGRGVYLDAATSNALPYDAAAAVYDTLLRFLHTSVRAVLILSAIVLVAVFFAGSSRFAAWFRLRVREGANWLGEQADEAGWGWLAPNGFVMHRKRGLRIAVGVLAFIIVFFWDRATPGVILSVTLFAVVALGLIEVFGREPLPDEPPGGPADAPGGVTPAPLPSG